MAERIECVGCGRLYKTERGFERHAHRCTSGGRHKPLAELSFDELQAVLRAELVREGAAHPDPAGMLQVLRPDREDA